jgi:hypothetical protein
VIFCKTYILNKLDKIFKLERKIINTFELDTLTELVHQTKLHNNNHRVSFFSTGPRRKYGLAASRRTARDAELMMMMKDLDCRTSLEREKRV